MKRYAIRASKIRANFLQRAIDFENDLAHVETIAAQKSEILQKKFYKATHWTKIWESKKIVKELLYKDYSTRNYKKIKLGSLDTEAKVKIINSVVVDK